jgi:hypothetical protein
MDQAHIIIFALTIIIVLQLVYKNQQQTPVTSNEKFTLPKHTVNMFTSLVIAWVSVIVVSYVLSAYTQKNAVVQLSALAVYKTVTYPLVYATDFVKNLNK